MIGGPGRCEISPSEVNPLKYRDGRPEELVANYTLNDFRPSAGDKSNFPEKVDSTSNAKYNRVKRDTEMIVRAETYNNDGKKYRVVKMVCFFIFLVESKIKFVELHFHVFFTELRLKLSQVP